MRRFALVLALLSGLLAATALAADAMPAAEPIFAATMTDLQGKPVAMAELKGKVAVLNFWATWCTPCRNEIPHLVEGFGQYAPRGVVFLGAAVEDNAETVATFAKAYHINYPLAMAGREQGIALLQAMGNKIAGLPYTLVLDRQGRVVAVKRGVMTLERLRQILDPLLP